VKQLSSIEWDEQNTTAQLNCRGRGERVVGRPRKRWQVANVMESKRAKMGPVIVAVLDDDDDDDDDVQSMFAT
jgi:hypothetical protein